MPSGGGIHSISSQWQSTVSVKETAVCIIDEAGKICREVKVSSHPDDLIVILKDPRWHIERVGLEAGPLSQWLFETLAKAGVPTICIETRHTKAFLKAQPNKTDRNDARGIAQMMRVNLYKPVHVKTLTSQKRRALLTARQLLQEKAIAIENDIRGLLRNFGLKVGLAGKITFEERVCELVTGFPELAEIMNVLLSARTKLRDEFKKLHKKVLELTSRDEICRLLMTVPGVGPVVSLAFVSTIDIPQRFKNSKCPTQNSSLAIRRVIRLIDEMNIHASADAIEASQSFARRRQRLSQAKVRSTIHRLGKTTKPLA